MIAFKIVGIGIVTMVLSILIRQYRPEMAVPVSLCGAVLILSICVPYLSSVIKMFEDIAKSAGVNLFHIEIVLKIIGISYICQFAADISKDAGEASIAGKIELGGKIIIISLSMPIIYNLLDLVNHIINF